MTPPNPEFNSYVKRSMARWSEFDIRDLAPQFAEHFRTSQRIKVRSPDGHERTGYVGVTTGWRPVFILLSRKNERGSCDVLREHDEITAIHDGRAYIPTPVGVANAQNRDNTTD